MARKKKDGGGSIIIYEQAGATRVTVTATIEESGALTMAGQDLGEAPQKYFDRDEYEYFVRVPAEATHLVALHLLRDRFGTSGTPTSEFMEWLKTRNIPYEFATF